ncbi:isoquinoline 1-oxidoreductase molybdopterin-binding subunit IorB-related protein (plasmid) [Rhizobium gallicum]|uniref:Isoquinoline 1-oxidoreductase molybdopterin-binding subunit IorB-related protein n=2 Tax=Rhizobium gallicum TaxID=56730 RepID=A0A1L5NY72_9HYPH|nr:molybdopterin cofactor-binding domain-containing protein [Rhizobium gallicum]APO72837.1 isoquinoline 1-oxidoreductase molybdopterin-binding subunit IorB-related protein [Rhizobium gallicum]
MDILTRHEMSRRGLLAGTGALIVSFSTIRALAQEIPTAAPEKPKLPGSLDDDRYLDSWIRIDSDGKITVFTGKVELGQGIGTALIQVAAEELEVDPSDIALVTADTGRTPDEGFTAGSQSMQNSGTAIRNAAAQVRGLLIAEAARRFNLPPDQLRAKKKSVSGPDGRSTTYGELVSGQFLHVEAQPQSKLKQPDALSIIGRDVQRIDIPGKVTGAATYVQDLRLEGMVHARVIRPPSYGATLKDIDATAAAAMAGVISVIRDGSFLAVVAEKEWQAIKAMRAVEKAAQWDEPATLPEQTDLAAALTALEKDFGTVAESGHPSFSNGAIYEATFTRPYQMHGSIGPSCAVAHLKADGSLDIWSHTQGVFPDRGAIAQMLAMPEEKVRVIHMEGSGCYGHNGADDAAADAALIAMKIPGRPVRVQWMREQEHMWEPYGPGMVSKVRASLDASGRIDNWTYDVWSNTHSTRPGNAGSLLAGRAKEQPTPLEPPKLSISPNGSGDRNADPLYVIPNRRVLWHFLPDMPLRVSALRGLGAYANVFSIESAMDELAIAAKADPVEFRLRHLEDDRASDVVKLAADKFGWRRGEVPSGHGRGFAFARYKNRAAYLAVALEAKIERETGRVQVLRAVAAIDAGQAVNPDGIRNQTEGGILQSISWTLYEAVTFDRTRITSIDWASYPILRFGSVPESVEVHILDRPGQPFLGTGEAAQGPTCAALANAIRNATGKRLGDLPLSRNRVKEATRLG